MAQKLNHTALQALKPRAKAYKATDGAGLFAEVLPTGSIVWRFQYLLHGKRGKVTLGKYRSAGESKTHIEMSLDSARDQHRDKRRMVKNGIDPAAAKQQEKAAGHFSQADIKTVADLFDAWVTDKSQNTQRAARGFWEKDIRPTLGSRFVNTVIAMDVEAVVGKVIARGSPASGAKIAMILRQMYKFGVAKKFAVANPAMAVDLPISRESDGATAYSVLWTIGMPYLRIC